MQSPVNGSNSSLWRRRSSSYSVTGRSTREMEEEIVKLRNENFNLKLRLHCKGEMEETSRSKRRQESLAMELEEAKVVINSLRLELIDKTQLLKDAAIAITEHEEEQRRFSIENQAKVAELEGIIAHLQLKDSNSLGAEIATDLQRMEEKVALASSYNPPPNSRLMAHTFQVTQQADELSRAKAQIESLKRDLEERDEKYHCGEVKLNEVMAEKTELMSLVQQQYSFSVMANQMMEIQKMELDACLQEKLGFIKKMNELVPELNLQNDLLKEAAVTVQNLIETTDLKENFSVEVIAKYKSAIIESKIEIHNITQELERWTRQIIPADVSSSSSLVSMDLIDSAIHNFMDCKGIRDNNSNNNNLSSRKNFNNNINNINSNSTNCNSIHSQSTYSLNQKTVDELSSTASTKSRSPAKQLRHSAKKSLYGLHQFVKCWSNYRAK